MYWICLGWSELSPYQPLQIVLYFVVLARKEVITHQCFCHCWVVLVQHWGSLHLLPTPTSKSSRSSMGKRLEGDIARTSDPNWPKSCSVIKSKRKEEGTTLVIKDFIFRSNHHTEALLPGKWLDMVEVENKSFCSPLLLCMDFAFLYLTAFILTHENLVLFSLSCPAEQRGWESDLLGTCHPARVNPPQ